ncbi:Serine/threonine protein kinase [Sandaracinus amylolyticus]|nr:Serine/threonine protein kinase [Sandaracinus amylolyticus]
MAETFVGVRRGPGGFEQRVCVKRILPEHENDALFVAQFLQEARVSARLQHTHIVQVLDFGVADGSHFLVLELVEGMDLERLLETLQQRGERLPPSLVAFIGQNVALALDHAHTHASGAVHHRDVSPSNVLVSRAGEIKLSDFGIAKAVSQTEGGLKTRTGVIKGKVPYLPPEYQLTGRFDARSDLFALGVMLFECLAGERPFVGVTDLDTCHRIITGRHPSLAQLRPDAPPALVAAIERLLRPEPDERYASAAALIDALAEVAPPPTARRQLADLVRVAEVEALTTPLEPLAGATTALDAPAAGTEPVATMRVPMRRRSLGIAAAAAVIALAAAVIASVPSSPPDAVVATPPTPALPPAAPPAEIAPAAAPPPEPAVAATEAPAEPLRALPRREPRARPPEPPPVVAPALEPPAEPEPTGMLRVVVAPWGLVWIDGRYMGRAPVDVAVSPGSHRVEAGFERPTVSQTIRVGAGETERAFVELTQPPG